MVVLVAFSFLAGIVTILSPCILPVLPIVLSSTVDGKGVGKSRPWGVVTGFIASFTFFTLFLSTIVRVIGIPADILRFVSVVVIAGFGLSLLFSRFQLFLERFVSSLTSAMPRFRTSGGFGGGLLLGLSLGLLWTPCVGPILASIISLAITGTVTLDAVIITLAYSVGTAIPMFIVMIGGSRALQRVPWLVMNPAKIQKTFGILMIATAFAILTNLDRRFQVFILDRFPKYGAGLTRLEENDAVKKELARLKDNRNQKQEKEQVVLAPEIIAGGQWFNSEPLTLQSLRGKVVLIDFWTYTCINCQRTFPYLRRWWEKYKDDGLVIIGVHSPEFEFEKSAANVAQAVKDFKLEYPIVQDNDFATWRAYENRYWPAKYFIDKEGSIRFFHAGEGEYDESERVIQNLLSERGVRLKEKIDNPQYQVSAATPETYLGYKRLERFASPESIRPDETSTYSLQTSIPVHYVAFGGRWTVGAEYARPSAGAHLMLEFDAKEVFLVMRSSSNAGRVRVSVDGKVQYQGEDVREGMMTVVEDRLYKLVMLPEAGQHTLILEFLGDGVELYAFTFG